MPRISIFSVLGIAATRTLVIGGVGGAILGEALIGAYKFF